MKTNRPTEKIKKSNKYPCRSTDSQSTVQYRAERKTIRVDYLTRPRGKYANGEFCLQVELEPASVFRFAFSGSVEKNNYWNETVFCVRLL